VREGIVGRLGHLGIEVKGWRGVALVVGARVCEGQAGGKQDKTDHGEQGKKCKDQRKPHTNTNKTTTATTLT
jgi:hypothetical protein